MKNLTLYVILACVVLLVINLCIAYEFYSIAQKKGHHEDKYFWWPFFCGFIGYAMVIALPNRNCVPSMSTDELPEL